MFKQINCFLIFSTSLLITTTTLAVNNEKLSCQARHLDTEQHVEVKIISGIPSKKIATAQWPLGYPTIVIDDSAYIKLPKNAKQFIYYHECAHLKYKTKDEHEADCRSIKMLVEKQDYKELDIRILVKTLAQEFGLSRRWSNLLMCEGILKNE